MFVFVWNCVFKYDYCYYLYLIQSSQFSSFRVPSQTCSAHRSIYTSLWRMLQIIWIASYRLRWEVWCISGENWLPTPYAPLLFETQGDMLYGSAVDSTAAIAPSMWAIDPFVESYCAQSFSNFFLPLSVLFQLRLVHHWLSAVPACMGKRGHQKREEMTKRKLTFMMWECERKRYSALIIIESFSKVTSLNPHLFRP